MYIFIFNHLNLTKLQSHQNEAANNITLDADEFRKLCSEENFLSISECFFLFKNPFGVEGVCAQGNLTTVSVKRRPQTVDQG